MAPPLNSGDIRRHVGTVTSSASDMTISVLVPALSQGEIDDVRPEFVTPLRYRPREGDPVVIYQRLGALRPSLALTWVGWDADTGNQHITPPWLDAGLVHLLGESGRIQVVLNDEDAPTPDGPIGSLHLGFRDAAEPLVLGEVYRVHKEADYDLLAELIDALDTELGTMSTLDIAHSIWVGAVAGHPLLTAVLGAPGGTMQAALTAHQSAIATARNLIKALPSSVRARFVGPFPADQYQKATIPDHLSNYVFTSLDPDPNPYTNEDEEDG